MGTASACQKNEPGIKYHPLNPPIRNPVRRYSPALRRSGLLPAQALSRRCRGWKQPPSAWPCQVQKRCQRWHVTQWEDHEKAHCDDLYSVKQRKKERQEKENKEEEKEEPEDGREEEEKEEEKEEGEKGEKTRRKKRRRRSRWVGGRGKEETSLREGLEHVRIHTVEELRPAS